MATEYYNEIVDAVIAANFEADDDKPSIRQFIITDDGQWYLCDTYGVTGGQWSATAQGRIKISTGSTAEYKSADGVVVGAGKRFWNNDLRVCEVIETGRHGNVYSDTGCIQVWHKTTHGDFDTMTGEMQKYGRLGRRFEGKNAEDYEPGTNYADIK